MPRPGRLFLPDEPLHVIQRGNSRQPIFFAVADLIRYRGWLIEAAAAHACRVHAYVLMTNRVHLLVTPRDAHSVPPTLQSLGRRHVRFVNDTDRCTGTLWEGRYRAAAIDSVACFSPACARDIAAPLGRRTTPLPPG